MVIIDEAQKAIDCLSSFRPSYDSLDIICRTFGIPNLFCSASRTRCWIELLLERFMPENNMVLNHPIKRDPIEIESGQYNRSKGGKDKTATLAGKLLLTNWKRLRNRKYR